MTHLRDRMLEELERRNYAPGTARAYLYLRSSSLPNTFIVLPTSLARSISASTSSTCFGSGSCAAKTVAQRVAALRFFYVKTLKRQHMLEHLPFPRLPEKLPTVLSREEVEPVAGRFRQPAAPHDADDAVRDRRSPGRVMSAEDLATSTASAWWSTSVRARAGATGMCRSVRRCSKSCAATGAG